ncbi:MAG: hypothetical protein HQ541_08615 [Mariniphaga sp.]|nr:hypothetical protein [Mariniphaga sp.]
MKSLRIAFLLIIVFLVGIGITYFMGCKKIDLIKLAFARTDEVTNILSTSVTANGEVVDIGEVSITDHGFCWSLYADPTINNNSKSLGSIASTAKFSYTITNLSSNTSYNLRTYIQTSKDIIYGNTVDFKTEPGGTSEWLHYDDGYNYTGVGYTEGGNFDVAIRFTTQDLQQYNGFSLTKIKFFPKLGSPVSYHVTIWEGYNPPDLVYIELVPNPIIEGWTEFSISEPYTINANMELWVGYWIFNQPPNEYPAGADDGPAITGYGDMISKDDGETWDALSILNPALDYNWNVQVYVTNVKGREIELVRKAPLYDRKKFNTHKNGLDNTVSSGILKTDNE